MTNLEENDRPQVAVVHRTHRLSAIWLLPFVALLIGMWMLFEQWRERGPSINITFSSASGLEEGKTAIKTRDVQIGQVERISLSGDLQSVVVEARIKRHAEDLLREDTQFWIVEPRIGFSGVSGLNTLVSGVHIELSPGQAKEESYEFSGLDEPPVTPANTPGMPILLSSSDLASYAVGDPVVYKGINVGRIEEIDFDVEERVVQYRAFIKAPYHRLITEHTRFWNTSGLNVDLTADGISVQTASLQSLLTSSISFGVPDGRLRDAPAAANSLFVIHSDYAAATSLNYRYAVEYVLLIEESVRGLTEGAPVEYRGIKVGRVLAVNYTAREALQDQHLMQGEYRIPVLISLEPGRVGYRDTKAGKERIREQTNAWIKGGLRARLKSGNLLTGKLFVELQHYADEVPAEITYFNDRPVIPTLRGEISLLTQKLETLTDKISKLPLEAAAEEISLMLKEFRQTAVAARGASDSLSEVLDVAQREQLVQHLSAALESFARLSAGYAEGSAGHSEIVATVAELNARLQELQPLLLRLNQQPNSLIFSSGPGADLQPKANRNKGDAR